MIKKLIKFFTPNCRHRFNMFDVIKIHQDPLCVFCHKPLSELKN